jgi:hypothetical protein
MASTSKTFDGITPEIWNCMKDDSKRKHDTVYDPPDADTGLATTVTIIGKLELAFSLDREQGTVTFTIEHKPILVPASQIWDGIQDAIDKCASK